MNTIAIVLLVLFGVLILNCLIDIVVSSSTSREGLENDTTKTSGCDANTQVFKNAGAIANIKDQLNTIQATMKTVESDIQSNKSQIKEGQGSIKALGTAQVKALHAQVLTEAVEGDTGADDGATPSSDEPTSTTKQNVGSSSVDKILGTNTSGMMSKIMGTDKTSKKTEKTDDSTSSFDW